MGIKERKLREREEFKNMALAAAYEMIKSSGLEDFSMRKLAGKMEYSASKLYLFFESKEILLTSLGEEICKRLLSTLEDVPCFRDKKKRLLALARSYLDFYTREPEAAAVLHSTCFQAKKLALPPSFLAAERLFSQAVEALEAPALKTSGTKEKAVEMVKMALAGSVLTLKSQPDEKEHRSAAAVLENSLSLWIEGWTKA